MSVTLNDVIKASRQPMQKAFITDLLRYSDVLTGLTFESVQALQITDKRWQTLPSAGYRKFGGGYTESSGTTEDVAETLSLLGGDVKIDKVAGKIAAVESPIVTQMKMKAKAVAFTFNDSFINGDHGSNPDGFEGLKKRVSNMPARMTIDLAVATVSLKVLATAATTNTFLDALHAAIQYVDGANRIYANENTLIKFGSALRGIGMPYDTIKMYDKVFNTFNGIPIVDIGLKGDKSTEIITSTEDPGNATLDSTSIYVVRMDTDDGLRGIQLPGMDMKVYDPLGGNEMEAGPQYLRRIDWAVGLRNPSNYVIARIKGFKMAAS